VVLPLIWLALNEHIVIGNIFDPPLVLPAMMEGETLFSWCARFHKLSGNVIPRYTSRMLFSNSEAGLRHDLPNNVSEFLDRTQFHLGDAEELLFNRTVLSFYAPFIPNCMLSKVTASMLYGTPPFPKILLKLNKAKLGAAAPLKACPECIKSQLQKYQFSWWSVKHQWRSVYVCYQHLTPLLVANEELHRVSLKEFFLPSNMPNQNWSPSIVLNSNQLECLKRVAIFTEALTRLREMELDDQILRYSYILQAQSKGWGLKDDLLRLKEMRKDFDNRYAGLSELSGLEFLAAPTKDDVGFFEGLLHQVPGNRAPIKHIFMMDFLFDDVSSFLDKYQIIKSAKELGHLEAVISPDANLSEKIKNMYVIHGKTKAAISREMGISYARVISKLKSVGIRQIKKKITLTPQFETELNLLINKGLPIKEIAEDVGVRPGYVGEYIARNETLKDIYKQATFIRQRDFHRDFVSSQSGLSRKYKSIQWLLKNDEIWLNSNFMHP